MGSSVLHDKKKETFDYCTMNDNDDTFDDVIDDTVPLFELVPVDVKVAHTYLKLCTISNL